MKKYLSFLGSLLLGCYVSPMYCFVANYPQLDLLNSVLAMALFGGIFLCIAGFLWLWFRNVDKVSFLMYGLATIFWFSHPIARFLRDNFLFFTNLPLSGYQWPLLFICCLVSILGLFFLLKFCSKFVTNINKILSVFIFILSGLLLINGGQKIFQRIQTSDNLSQNINLNKDGKIYPNVYHILLDAHPNQKGMEIIGGDLKPFYNELESLGFVTFPESRSNYPGTMWTVASMLNMDYLEEGWKQKPANYFPKLIGNSKVFNHFQLQGFNVLFTTDNVMVKSLYPSVKQLFNHNQTSLGLCIYHFLLSTPIKHTFEKIFAETFTQSIRQNIKNVFKNLELGKMHYGKTMNVFYGHVLCPHEPCIFAKQAKNLAFSGFAQKFDTTYLLNPEIHKLLCQNVYGIDNVVLNCIKDILKQYETESIKPIIILHSDHSILYCANGLESPYVTTDTVYGNLLALYIPKEWKQDAKDLTFINLYRWIFNHLFGDNFEYFKESRQE